MLRLYLNEVFGAPAKTIICLFLEQEVNGYFLGNQIRAELPTASQCFVTILQKLIALVILQK